MQPTNVVSASASVSNVFINRDFLCVMIILFMVCMPKPMARFAVYVKAVLMLIRVLLG